MTACNVTAGFTNTGIFPFHGHTVKPRYEKFKDFDPEALSKKSNISYIPLFSPDRKPYDEESDLDSSLHSSDLPV